MRSLIAKICWLMPLAACATACATSSTTVKITSSVPAFGFALNADTEEEEAMGPTPLSVTLAGRTKTIVLRADGHEPQHVVLIEDLPAGAEVLATLPVKAGDDAEPEPAVKAKGPKASAEQSRALDATLRVQRLFLRGQNEEARYALERLSADFGDTFASLLLKGHVAGAGGDLDGAEKYYRQLYSAKYRADAAAGNASAPSNAANHANAANNANAASNANAANAANSANAEETP